jgi:hypothetical protein
MEAAPPRGRPEFDPDPDHITVRPRPRSQWTKSEPPEGWEGRTAGERERFRERRRLSSDLWPDLCRRCREVVGKRIWRLASGRRISVTRSLWLEDRGPVVRRRERGSRGRGRWADVQWVLFVVLEWWEELSTSPEYQIFCSFLLLADVSSDYWWV